LNGVSKCPVNVKMWGATLPILRHTDIGNNLANMQERLLQGELDEAYRPYWLPTIRARLRVEPVVQGYGPPAH
jgi:hypothetical protein